MRWPGSRPLWPQLVTGADAAGLRVGRRRSIPTEHRDWCERAGRGAAVPPRAARRRHRDAARTHCPGSTPRVAEMDDAVEFALDSPYPRPERGARGCLRLSRRRGVRPARSPTPRRWRAACRRPSKRTIARPAHGPVLLRPDAPPRAHSRTSASDFPGRVWDPPIAEIGYVGTGIGAAISRPATDRRHRHRELHLPGVQPGRERGRQHPLHDRRPDARADGLPRQPRASAAAGRAQHSHSPQAMLWNTPGHQDHAAVGAARRARPDPHGGRVDDDPVFWADHVKLFDVDRADAGRARGDPVRRRRHQAARHGRHDRGHLVHGPALARGGRGSGGGGHLASRSSTRARWCRSTWTRSSARSRGPGGSSSSTSVIDRLRRRRGDRRDWSPSTPSSRCAAPIRRVATLDVPIPFSPPLEAFVGPSEERIADAVRAAMG